MVWQFPSFFILEYNKFNSSLRSKCDIVFQIELGLRVTLFRLELDSQLLLDGEDGVVLEILTVLVEDLCCQRLVPLVADL